jgi:hypothetical protein
MENLAVYYGTMEQELQLNSSQQLVFWRKQDISQTGQFQMGNSAYVKITKYKM